MPAISVLMKPSSGMCNMDCDYCFYCDETAKRQQESYGFMSEQTLKNVIRKTMLRAEGVVSYAFQGGEPTLRGLDFFRRVMEYERQYNKKGLQVQNALQTNGILIDEDWCAFFREHHFLVGVSLDGTGEIHDRFRHMRGDRSATFDRVVRGIHLLEDYGVDFNILTVVHREVASHVREIYDFYREMGWNYQQYIACLDPLGETRGESEFALEPAGKNFGKEPEEE